MTATTTNQPVDRSVFSFDALEIVTGHKCDREFARIIGVTMRTIQRWRRGGIPERRVDQVAVALQEHPGFIWPDQWWGRSANG